MTEGAIPRTRFFADCVGVFQGGGCRAAAHAGAFDAAKARGVQFQELAGASAGAIVAVLISAGAQPSWLNDRLATLDFKSLLREPQGPPSFRLPLGLRLLARGKGGQALNLIQHQAMYSGDGIGEWVEEQLRTLLPQASQGSVKFRDLPLPVSVIVSDIKEGQAKTYGTASTPDASVARAVQASCALPYFFEPNEGEVDGGLLSNLPSHLIDVDPGEPRQILAFALEDDGRRTDPSNLLEFTAALTTTVLRGSQEIQTRLQPGVHVVRINTGATRATDFDKIDAAETQRLWRAGHDAVSSFFGQENLLPSAHLPVRTQHDAQTLDILAQQFLLATRSIRVVCENTRWVFELFTALMLARQRGVEVHVTLSAHESSAPRATYQRELLGALGCRLSHAATDAPIVAEAYLFDNALPRATAVIYSSGGNVQASVHRQQDGETGVISLLNAALARVTDEQEGAAVDLRLISGSEADVVAALRPVDQYADPAVITIEDVPLAKINSWAKYALSYKQRQQQAAARFFRENGLEAFEPAWVTLSGGRRSLLVPPVVEASPDSSWFTLVNGASRLLLLHREGHLVARCAVVRDAGGPPPASTVREVRQLPVRIGRRGVPQDRYDNFAEAGVRAVESFAHTSEELAASATDGGTA